MNQHGARQFRRFRVERRFVTLAFLGMMVGCGAVGAPIPPEETGIEAKLLKEQQQANPEKDSTPQDIAPIEEDTLVLPPLSPIGSR